MKRITVDQVREAYERTGLKPQIEHLLEWPVCSDTPDCGCGLGALFVDAGGVPSPHICVSDAAKFLDMSKAYAYGFSDGFDGRGDDAGPHTWGLCVDEEGDDRYRDGYEDGKAAGDLMLGRE